MNASGEMALILSLIIVLLLVIREQRILAVVRQRDRRS
jgi:hypothetical protein